MSYETADIEIQTFLQSGHGSHHCNDSITGVIQSRGIFSPKEKKWWLDEKSRGRQRSSDSDSSYESNEAAEQDEVKVSGSDIGDLPTEYTVKGLRPNEFPVIGTYVDKRLIPGFVYKVRKLGSKDYLFDGRALRLLSVGMGYGKRITMEGDTFNVNDNYIYSDSHPDGYGFSLQVMSVGDKFTVYDKEQRRIGNATIERVHSQKELSTDVTENGEVQKTVAGMFACNICYENLCLVSSQRAELQAVLVSIKTRKSRQARVQCVRVDLENVGLCIFELQ